MMKKHPAEKQHNDIIGADSKIEERKGWRKGMALLDLVLAIGLVGLILGILIWIWVGLKPKFEAKTFNDKINVVISAVEKARSDYNTGAYLAASGSIPTINKLKIAMGGTKAVSALGGWNYNCSAGNASTINITTENMTDTDALDSVVLTVNDKYTDWTATRNGTSITLTRPNSVCK